MKIKMKKFGKLLISRPAGKEAYLAACAYILPQITGKRSETIQLDFSGVAVLSPSWADEFITKIRQDFPNKLKLTNLNNASIKSTLSILDRVNKDK